MDKISQNPEQKDIENPQNTALGMLYSMINQLDEMIDAFMATEGVTNNLSTAEKMRLISAGVKNYGFIDKSWDLARDNNKYLPPFFSLQEMGTEIGLLDAYREMEITLDKFKQIVGDCLLVSSDRAFRQSLRFYNSLKEQAKSKQPGAQSLLDALKPFFRRRGVRTAGSEPTEKELDL
jgi:hypothetical protein